MLTTFNAHEQMNLSLFRYIGLTLHNLLLTDSHHYALARTYLRWVYLHAGTVAHMKDCFICPKMRPIFSHSIAYMEVF